MTVRLSQLAANAQADAIAKLLNGGTLEIHGGVMPGALEEPSSAALAIFRLNKQAFQPAALGFAILNKPADVLVDNTGVPSWFRFRDIFGNAVYDGDASQLGISGNLPMNSTLEIGSYKLAINLQQE